MNWKIIFRSLKNRDMQKRLGIVLGLVVAYRFLAAIPIPLADPTQLKTIVNNLINQTDLGGFINLLSGGALGMFSIITVGLGPFITASIITQLLTKVVPRIEELHKDGESGRKRINQWTRIITVPLALVQSIAYMYLLRQTALSGVTTGTVTTSLHEWVIAVMAMTAGAVLLMWIGELLTEQGIGNGISLLIYAGIISQLPATLGTLGSSLFDTSSGALNVFGWFTIPVNPIVFWVTLIVGLIALAATYILVKINEAQRVVTINYAKRVAGNTTYGGVKSILPVKLIAAGVIPVIFAVAFISLPAFVGQVLKATANPHYTGIADTLITWFSAPTQTTYLNAGWPTLIYPSIYFVLVILFTYFYTGIVFNSQEISENLQKQGGFVEGIRPGLQTEKYLARTVNRLVLFGSIALGLVSVLPFAIEYVLTQFGITATNVAVGGTGLLIVVTVGLETIRQIDSRALMVTYDDYA